MASGSLPGVLRYLRQLVHQQGSGTDTDRQLLERFTAARDEAAFTHLLERHGPMVWGVCQRVLRDATDAEDAFQATFLVLARKASVVRWRESIGGWLHAVAQRVAWKARTTAARTAELAQRLEQRENEAMPDADPLKQAAGQELRTILDEELAHLPEKYRAPLVLCYLEGRTNEEAADQLGWTKGTVSGRLSRARDLLRRRLARRGLALSAGTLASALPAATASAAPPAGLLAVTLKAAMLDSTALASAGVISAKAATLAESALDVLFVKKWKLILGIALLVCLLGGTAIFLAYRIWVENQPEAKQEASLQEPEPPANQPAMNPEQQKFIQAEVTLHMGRDGVPGEPPQELVRIIRDKATLDRLTSFFPDLAQGKMTNLASGWLTRLTIKFQDGGGSIVTVKSSWTEWNEGAGNHKVQGNLMKYTGELFEVARLTDQGLLMDPWRVVGFEEGGKKRLISKGELTITDTQFTINLVTYTKAGLQFDGRFEYQSPREYSVNPNKNPKELNFYSGTGKGIPSQRGIYAIERDTLKICLDKNGNKRPAEFKTQPGNNNEIMIILERAPAVVQGP